MSAGNLSRRSFSKAAMAAVFLSAGTSPKSRSLTARAPSGEFEGLTDGTVIAFKGIRYAMAGRFQRPQRIPRDKVMARAWNFGPVAPQRGKCSAVSSEDCLFLNIWTPELDPRALRPVMVYFHGGAYTTGTVTEPVTHGHRLSRAGDVVVVTVNHRLNAFGYLFHPAIPANLGQADLIAALSWVRENIVAFGGDPARVMIFGQSGGGAKIATLMAMSAASGLFHAAATMSGQQVTASGPAHARARTRAFCESLGLHENDLDGLRSAPAAALVDALATSDPYLPETLYFGPVLDPETLPRHPFWPDAPAISHHIPMILGNCRDETRAFIDRHKPKVTGLSYDTLAEAIADEIRIDLPPELIVHTYRGLYPDWSAERLFYAITTDGRSWPGQWIEAEARAANSHNNTWVYRFDFASPADPNRGAAHTDDIPYVFNTLDAEGSHSLRNANTETLSENMIKAFAGLAASGRPGIAWPNYERETRQTLVFDSPIRIVSGLREAERRIWAQAPYIQPGS